MRKIEIDEAAPSRKVRVFDRNVDITAADIVDENIDRRRFREHPPAEIFARRRLANVCSKGPGLALAFTHLCGGSGEGVGVSGDKHDISPRLSRCERDRSAKPPAAPRDQKALTV
jgi:hypothetical protein